MSYIKYPKLTPDQFKACSSETEKYRALTAPYCKGAGVDIASQGVPVVPWAMSFDLPDGPFMRYSNNNPPKGPLHLRGFADFLPFESGSLDFVYSSHLLEDFINPKVYLTEWSRVLAIGGHLIILVPDKDLWEAAIRAGQNPNCSHNHEYKPGELTALFTEFYGHFEIVEDRLTALTPEDYTILFVAKKLR